MNTLLKKNNNRAYQSFVFFFLEKNEYRRESFLLGGLRTLNKN